MALDDLAGDVETLDAVGIDGALCQPAAFTIRRFAVDDFPCFLVEDFYEVPSDDFAFLLRVVSLGCWKGRPQTARAVVL